MSDQDWGFATRAIHAGQEPDPAYGAVTVPIYQTSTYAQDSAGDPKTKGYATFDYARGANPTRTALEECIASLESGTHGIAFASGLGAESAITYLLHTGDHVIAHNDLYGGTSRLFNQLIANFGVTFDYVDARSPEAVAAALRPNTKLVWIETPTNPLLNIIDIAALAEVTRNHSARLVVDNTFASPYLQRPLELGADIVLHSATKYLGGHSDVVLGAIVVKDEDLATRLRFIQNAAGAVPGPFDCWLVLRGIKTLSVRMREHCSNAIATAHYLEKHPAVIKVIYPGLPSHPDHELAGRQMLDFGGMLSIELAGGHDAAFTFLKNTKLFTLAESLGGVESLIEHPASMTHASVPAARRAQIGVGEGLVRLSVGIEDANDLIADLDRALATVSSLLHLTHDTLRH